MQRRDERRDRRRSAPRAAPADHEHEERGGHRDGDLRQADHDPGALERPVQPGEEQGVERLGVRGRHVGEEAERAARDERARERVALLDVLLEDVVALDGERREARDRCRCGDAGRRGRVVWSAPMPPTTTERYAVVSCHVERPLDDAVWGAFARLQERRPGGLPVAALMRPPDAAAGELDEERWISRAREAIDRAAHSGTTRTSRAPRTRDPRAETRGARAPRGRLASRARPDADAVLRRRLVHRPSGGAGVRRTAASGLHAPCDRPGYLAQGEPWAELGPGPRGSGRWGDGTGHSGRPDDARPRRPGARTGPPRATRRRCTPTSTTRTSWSPRRRRMIVERASRSSAGSGRRDRPRGAGGGRGQPGAAPRVGRTSCAGRGPL